MSYRINKVLFEGNLTSDPKYNKTTSNALVVNFRLANYRKYMTSKKEVKEETCFMNVVAWLKIAGICQKQDLRKGDLVWVEGRLQSKPWTTSSGNKRNSIEIMAESIRVTKKKDKKINNEEIEEDIKEKENE